MKKSIFLSTILFFSFVFVGCVSIEPMGYFRVETYTKPGTIQLEEKLQIELHDDIKDRFEVKGVGVRPMPIAHFRRLVSDNTKNNMNSIFKEVQVTNFEAEAENNEDLRLVIYRVKPYWIVNSVEISNRVVDGYSRNRKVPVTSSAFDVRSSLYKAQTLLGEIDFIAYSETQMNHGNQSNQIFINGFTKLQEQLQKEVVSIYRSRIKHNQTDPKASVVP